MLKYDVSAMYACYVQVCNFGESTGLAVMLRDFHQNCGLRNIFHMHVSNWC